MVELNFLANLIEERLNSNSLGLHFLVYADAGEMRKRQEVGLDIKDYTNCILDIISSNLTPIKQLSFQTMNVQLMVMVDLDLAGYTEVGQEKRKQSVNLLNVKNCLNEYLKNYNGQTELVNHENKTYAMSVVMSMPTDGQIQALGEITNGLPVYMNLTFSFLENGVNSNDCKILINGENIYFTRNVISLVKTADMNTFAVGSSGTSVSLANGKSFDMVIPTTTSEFCKLVARSCLKDGYSNQAVVLRVEIPFNNDIISENYICILGNCSINMDVGSNLGYNISLIEGIEHLLDYNGWNTYYEYETQTEIGFTGTAYVFWGDGTNDYYPNGGTANHTYSDGKSSHEIKIYEVQ